MGCFSWICSDTNKPLRIGCKGYLVCPDGNTIKESSYDGYGVFDGNDVYELVALWNREFLTKNENYIVPHNEIKISRFQWYEIYSDLTISNNQLKKVLENINYDIRNIGINIACYDEDNANLPYPIKICKFKKNTIYSKLEPSNDDPGQGR